MVYKFLKNYFEKNVYPFHMPGHKRNSEFFPQHLPLFDLTEISGTDNLSAPQGIILEFQKALASVYDTEYTLFCVNGATGCLLSSISYAAQRGGVLVARNCHKAVFNGIILSGAEHKFIVPAATSFGFAGEVFSTEVVAALDNFPDCAAVIITSPTYEGIVSNIEEIATEVHKRGKILIVDEAHGAHFVFSAVFPRSAVQCGADIVINSLHKTLPVLGQCACVHLSKRIDFEKFRRLMNFYQTSSPSYMLMAQTDYVIQKLIREPFRFENYTQMLLSFREEIKHLKNLRLFDARLYDKSKLTFCYSALPNAENILCEKFGVQIETSNNQRLIAMTSPADTASGFEKLKRGLYFIDGLARPPENTDFTFSASIMIKSMKDAFFAEKEEIQRENAAGRTSADFITPYPPGIPIIVPGEVFTEEVLEKMPSNYKLLVCEKR